MNLTQLTAPHSVHIWHADLPATTPSPPELHALLSPDEAARAARFRFPRDQHRFIRARAGLRLLLGHYLGRDPQSLVFRYNPQGKPALAEDNLFFNLSHTGDVVLYALSRERELGVDVELLRPLTELNSMIELVFGPAERPYFAALPPAARERAFFLAWTAKEATLKAMGSGLQRNPHDLRLHWDSAGRVIGLTDVKAASSAGWTLYPLHHEAKIALPENHVACLAIQQTQIALLGYHFNIDLADLTPPLASNGQTFP